MDIILIIISVLASSFATLYINNKNNEKLKKEFYEFIETVIQKVNKGKSDVSNKINDDFIYTLKKSEEIIDDCLKLNDTIITSSRNQIQNYLILQAEVNKDGMTVEKAKAAALECVRMISVKTSSLLCNYILIMRGFVLKKNIIKKFGAIIKTKEDFNAKELTKEINKDVNIFMRKMKKEEAFNKQIDSILNNKNATIEEMSKLIQTEFDGIEIAASNKNNSSDRYDEIKINKENMKESRRKYEKIDNLNLNDLQKNNNELSLFMKEFVNAAVNKNTTDKEWQKIIDYIPETISNKDEYKSWKAWHIAVSKSPLFDKLETSEYASLDSKSKWLYNCVMKAEFSLQNFKP